MLRHCRKIYGFYHIAIIGRWKEIFLDQVRLLKSSGLYNKTDKIFISLLGEDEDNIVVDSKFEIIYRSKDVSEREFPTLSAVRKFCKSRSCYIWYIHTKGASRTGFSFKDDNPGVSPIQLKKNIDLWRRYMEHFIIERHVDCINALRTNDICGVDYTPIWGFQGNFWWGTSEYIASLRDIYDIIEKNKHRHSRIYCIEYWISSNNGKVKCFYHTKKLLYTNEINEKNYKKITLCFSTTGEDTEAECLAAIEKSRDLFIFKEFRNISPLTCSANQVIDQVETDFFVPLDSDMILYPGFFKRIEESFAYLTGNCYQVLFPLWDTLTEESILALKVLRTDIMKQHPYRDLRVPDIEHYKRLKTLGYTSTNLKTKGEPPIGNHIIRGPKVCYLKYKDNYMSYRKYPEHFGNDFAWEKSQNDYKFLLNKYNKTRNEDLLYCIAGMMDGLFSDDSNRSKSFKESMLYTPEDALEYFRRRKMV